MKFDKSLLKTVLFAFGVVTFVIATYQTVLQNDLVGNYWIYMISLSCWLPLQYWRRQEARQAKEAEVARQVAEMNKPAKPAKAGNKKKRR
jgi:amino acid permease